MNLFILTANDWVQIALYFAVLFASVKPLGGYMARVYSGERTLLSMPLSWLERLLYRVSSIDEQADMSWKQYAFALIGFSVVSFVGLYAILRLQGMVGLNPSHMAGVSPDLAFNTTASFITNTNWQSYGGESTLSYLSQMLGLTVQNFLSAGVGMAVLIAMIRGFTGRKAGGIGNFWADLVRGCVYILLPLSLLWAVLLGSQGVVQTFSSYIDVPSASQTIAVGPVASQVAIKQLGTNGGGFFNTNSAHPFENPTPFSNFLEMLAILLIPAALCYTYGKMVGDTKQGWVILAAMTIILIPFMLFGVVQEEMGNPKFAPLHIEQSAGNMEGKEQRFGVVNSALWAAATTAASNGSVNAMHDSFTPLGGLVPLILIQFGEVIYGGVGSGLYGMIVFVIVTVFIAGLMVGRTPEYLGKKINAFEIKMASVAVLAPHLAALLGTAIAVLLGAGKVGVANPGAQGFSEILYAFSSAANNNGSAFAGLSANTPFYNTALGLAMLFGRYFVMIPVLAIAGSLAQKNIVPISAGTLPTATPLFVFFLVSVVIVVGVLTFVPSLALGPVAEYLHLMQ
ncbi:MAG TPA: potassium-transporting ATPase subunit KdpA [Rickettsiales bacterium]|nr:potassium-transporting ATPase subunit KdpA [Rickettsiales bacterium]